MVSREEYCAIARGLRRPIFPSPKGLASIPMPKGLILTHIFLGLPVGRIDTVEAMK